MSYLIFLLISLFIISTVKALQISLEVLYSSIIMQINYPTQQILNFSTMDSVFQYLYNYNATSFEIYLRGSYINITQPAQISSNYSLISNISITDKNAFMINFLNSGSFNVLQQGSLILRNLQFNTISSNTTIFSLDGVNGFSLEVINNKIVSNNLLNLKGLYFK